METKYSKEQFYGFTHRFIVRFVFDNDWRNDINITIYSNSGNWTELEDFIYKKKSDKVIEFVIEHCSSKEQDEMSSKIIDDILIDCGF